MLVLSITVVKSKWYQSGFFKFVMMIVVAVVAYFTGGAAYAAYGALAAGVVYAAAVVTILGLMGVNTGVLGQIIQVASAVVTMGMSTGLSAMSAVDIVLASAQVLTKFAVLAIDINTKGTMEALQEKVKAKQEELKESEKLIEEINESTQQGLWVGIQDRLPDTLYALSSTELMCSYEILYDYDGMFNDKINSAGIS